MSRAGWLWLTVLLVAPATSAAPYLQPGADAARTGVTGDEGPLHDEVALRVAVPGTRAPGSVPLIHERFVYVLVQASDHQAHDTNGVVRVSLDTGEVRTLVETRSPPLNGAMAPDRILVILDGEVAAFGTADGQALWTWPLPVLVGTPTWHTRCLPPAMQGSSVVVACGEIGQTLRDALGVRDEPVGSLASVTPEVALFVASLDVVTGKLQWLTQLPLAQDAPATPSRPRTLSAFQDSILPGFAVLQHHVVVLAEELMASDVSLTQVWLLDAADGSPVWGRALPGGTTDPARAAPSGPEEVRPNRIYGDPTGSDDEFYVALRELIAFDPRDPEPSWTQPLDRSSPNAVGGTALALRAPALYVASDDTLRRIDTTSRTVQWTHVLPPGEHFDDEHLLLAGPTLFARSHNAPNLRSALTAFQTSDIDEDVVAAFDARTGAQLWRHTLVRNPATAVQRLSSANFGLALGDGVIAAAGTDGTVEVVGRTPASLVPRVASSSLFPGVGAQVTVDLSGSEAGVLGPATEFRGTWGDGSEAEWQTDPVLTHTYAGESDYEATFFVRNDAGQTSQETVTFAVGSTPPNLLEQAFASDNQDITFGILGIAMAVTGGALGYARVRTRRNRLREELHTIDVLFDELAGRPADRDAMLHERRARARGLLADGKFDEGQFHVVAARLEELSRSSRQGTLEEEFPFLPVAIVRAIEAMLADGRVSHWERKAFLGELDRDEVLTKAQKNKVRAYIEAWFERDAAT